jgi:hypothetical protein
VAIGVHPDGTRSPHPRFTWHSRGRERCSGWTCERWRAEASGELGAGLSAFDSILAGPSALDGAIDDAPRLLSNCAERVMRMVMVGREM